MNLKKVLVTGLLLSNSFWVCSQNKTFIQPPDTHQGRWVDSVFNRLNRKEKIAQLFFIRAHTDKGKAYEDSIGAIIKRDRVGGLVFFQGGPGRQASLTQKYQNSSNVPLLVAMDAEWGLGMRLDSTISYPYQMTLGAIQDNNLIYEMGRSIAMDFKKIGMHLNFAPVVDINNNPKNPVINYRSFGDDKYKVASKGAAYMRGLMDEGVLVSIKHFPGHGDTEVDSHSDLPMLPFTRQRLDTLELYPFKELIKQGASGVMVAHMNIPSLDSTRNLPSTLSKPIVTGLLKNQLRFQGLAISDAMEMKGVVKFFPNGEADVQALIAGNDIIELSENTQRAIKLTRKALKAKRLSWEQINASVKKILAAKYWAGLNKPVAIDTSAIFPTLNRPEAQSLNQRLSDAAVTILNSDSLIRALKPDAKTAVISLGVTEVSPFQQAMKQYFPNSTSFILSKIASTNDVAGILRELRNYKQVIVAIHDYRKRPLRTLDYNEELKGLISKLAGMNVITCLFANPYTLSTLPGIQKSSSLIVNYQNSFEMQRAAAKVLGGQMGANGKLPVNVAPYFKNGEGLNYFPAPQNFNGQLE